MRRRILLGVATLLVFALLAACGGTTGGGNTTGNWGTGIWGTSTWGS